MQSICGNKYRCEPIIDKMLEHQPDSFEKHGRDMFEGIVEELKKFDASGRSTASFRASKCCWCCGSTILPSTTPKRR
jgi:hypothetical protein